MLTSWSQSTNLCKLAQLEYSCRRVYAAEVLLKSAAQHKDIPKSAVDELQGHINALKLQCRVAYEQQVDDASMWDGLGHILCWQISAASPKPPWY